MTDAPRKTYLHPANQAHGAPAGCILLSTKAENDQTGVPLVAVDPNGLAMTDDEADEFAAEVCRRWNAFHEKAPS